MFTGVARGPILSGDGKVLERFSLRVLKSIAAGIQPLNLKANAAVHESCGLLDDHVREPCRGGTPEASDR